MLGLFTPIPPYHTLLSALPARLPARPSATSFVRPLLHSPHPGGFLHLHSLAPFGMGLRLRGAPFRPGALCTPSVFLVCQSGQAGLH